MKRTQIAIQIAGCLAAGSLVAHSFDQQPLSQHLATACAAIVATETLVTVSNALEDDE